ncbi:MAG: erythromycin esterase family protein [Pseudomonadota bacterium]
MLNKFLSSVLFVCLLTLMQSVLGQNQNDLDKNKLLELHKLVIPLHQNNDYQALITQSQKAQIVLIGDASHGTHEFYQQRIQLSKQLIKTHKFKLIAIEANWPDTYILNQYIHSQISLSQLKAINPFKHYPVWLWKNQEMSDFLHWLRIYNTDLPEGERKINLYGIDLYSYHSSIKWVIDYFSMFYPSMSEFIITKYQCLLSYQEPGEYGNALANKKHPSCEQASAEPYSIFLNCQIPCLNFSSTYQQEAFFHAKQQAFIVKNNERYYHSIYTSDNSSASWNIRDQYMFDTLLTIRQYLNYPKTIVWAHVSHLGDARATSMAEFKQLNVGQLLRQHFKQQLFSIGMLTYKGNVIASDGWGKTAKNKILLEANKESYESLFHQLNISNFILLLKQLPDKLRIWLNEDRLQRHVGVVYIPENEIEYHYIGSQLIDQFDAIMYFDITTELQIKNNF